MKKFPILEHPFSQFFWFLVESAKENFKAYFLLFSLAFTFFLVLSNQIKDSYFPNHFLFLFLTFSQIKHSLKMATETKTRTGMREKWNVQTVALRIT